MAIKTIAELRTKYGIETNRSIRVEDGWAPVLDSLFVKLIKAGHGDYVFKHFECKEKFSELRISFNNQKYPYPPEVMRLTSLVCYEAEAICEFCTGPGTIGTVNGWMHVMCASCHKKESKENFFIKKR